VTNHHSSQGEDGAGEQTGGLDVQLARDLLERARAEGLVEQIATNISV
jgi:hypothetical protein